MATDLGFAIPTFSFQVVNFVGPVVVERGAGGDPVYRLGIAMSTKLSMDWIK